MNAVESRTENAPLRGAFSVKRSFWFWFTMAVTLFVLTPIAVIYSSVFKDTGEIWAHLAEYVLPTIFINTFLLVLGVSLSTFVLGVSLAWLTVQYDFPGRCYFQWFLLLPLAIPTYVSGFVWIGLVDFSSPLATYFRNYAIEVPQIRSLGGIIFVMSFALYPYVYLLARNAFGSMEKSVMDAASAMGMNSWQRLLRVAIPLARPWIVGGMMLVIMEALSDFGTVSVFNYDTFTTAIYKTWFGFFSLAGAAQLSSLLVTFVLIFVCLEMIVRGGRGYSLSSQGAVPIVAKKIRGGKAWLLTVYCLIVLSLGFLIPIMQLISWSSESIDIDLDHRYWSLLGHTLLLGFLAATIICSLSVLMSYGARRVSHPGMKWMTKLATMGYALPGTVLAVGIFSSLIWIDHGVANIVSAIFDVRIGKILTGTLAAMILAYTVRYLAVGYNPIESAMHRMTRSVEDAARIFGYHGLSLIARVHIPIIRRGLVTAFILVLVDVMKEMPITLMTRPFGWDTFATRIYEMTSEGEWQRAALPAVLLVITGIIPLMFLIRREERLVK